MAFVDAQVAHRIERAECELVLSATEAVARTVREAFVLPVAGGVAACSGADSPLTKVVGLGFAGRPAGDEWARIEARFDDQGAAVQVELSSLAESGLAELLTARGYALVGFENVLVLALRPGEGWPRRPGIAIEHSPDSEIDLWIDVVGGAFAAPDTQGVAAHESFPRAALERVMRAMCGARGMVRYLARRDGVAAGGASLRVSPAGRVAQLCGAGTLPDHRRRGVQAALLERRLADAAGAGCEYAVVTTAPGSKSQENAQRLGFELAYVRTILRREPRAVGGDTQPPPVRA